MPPAAANPTMQPDGQTGDIMTSCHNISALRKFGMGSGREGERALFFCCAVGAGHAPPATKRQREPNGGTRKYGFPLWGKLSPQVTDEGALAGHFPLIRRAGAPPSPQGEGLPPAILQQRESNGGTARDAYMRPLQTRRKRRTITKTRQQNNATRRGGIYAARSSQPDDAA